MGYDFEAKEDAIVRISLVSQDGVSCETHEFHVKKGVKYNMGVEGTMEEELEQQILENQEIVGRLRDIWDKHEFEGFFQWYLMYVNRDSKTIGSDKFETGMKKIQSILKGEKKE